MHIIYYFNNESNKDSLLKIFNQDQIDYFINEIIELKNIIQILEYYTHYLFESKKDDIILIKESLEVSNNKTKYEEYIKDLDIAKKMNVRYKIIDYIFNLDYKGKHKTEEIFKKCVKKWEIFEGIINNKKLNKMKLKMKRIIYDFFNDPENNDYTLKIFDRESYQLFTENYHSCKKNKITIDFF